MSTRDALLDEALRTADPLAGAKANPTPAEAEALLASIVASDPREGVPSDARPTRFPARTRRRRLLVAVPVTAAVLAVLVASLPGGDKDDKGTLPVLAQVAAAAAAQPPIPGDLPFLYLKTQYVGTATAVAGGRGFSYYAPSTRQLWIARDGSGLMRDVAEPPRWVSAADREAWEASGAPAPFSPGRRVSEERLPPGGFPNLLPGGTALAELPTDAAELAAWIEAQVQDPNGGAGAGNGFSVAVRSLVLAAEILSNPFASSELRAALYEAAGEIRGIEYLGPATDQLGRHGVAVGAQSANSGAPTVYSLIFDPETAQVLATQEEVLEAPSALPDEGYPRKESTLYLATGAARSPGGKPQLWTR